MAYLPTDIRPLGSLYNKSSWTDLTDFVQVGGTYAVSSNKINFSGGANDYSNILEINRLTALEKWKITVKVKITTSTAINGFSIGIRNSNPAFANNFVAWFRPFDGLLRIEKVFNTPLATSASSLSLSVDDEVEVTFERDINNFYATARNVTTNSTSITVSLRTEQDIAGATLTPSIGYYSIYNIGGTFTLNSISVESKETVNADVLVVGTSKTVGYYGQTFENRWASRLNNDFTIVALCGSSDTSTQWLTIVSEIISLKPKKVILENPCNDERGGMAQATSQSQYASIVTSLQNAGIDVYHLASFFETVIDFTFWNTYINANYPAGKIINVWDVSQRPGFLNSDNIHISPAGQKLVYETITSAFKIQNSAGKPHVPYNSLYSTSEGVAILKTPATDTFSILKFGGETASFPALKINGASLDLRNATDAAYGDFRAKGINGTGGIQATGSGLSTGAGCNLQYIGGESYFDSYDYGSSTFKPLNIRATQWIFNNGSSSLFQILSSGNTGVGIAPTAALHIKGGSASANSAPLKFTSGTNLTTPEAGTVEYDGTNLFFTPSSTRNILAQISGSTSLTTGSIPFAGAGGILLQDNTNLIWDDTNNRLRVAVPSDRGAYAIQTDGNAWVYPFLRVEGNIGINTSAASAALTIDGSIYETRGNNTDIFNYFDANFGGNPNIWYFGTNASSDGSFTIVNSTVGTNFKILRTGEVGIGLSPTAKLHLAAGTATANTAPLKFTSGTNLTTVENGTVEYDGTNYFASSGGVRHTLAKTLTATATLNFGSTAAGSSSDLTITVTGAADGDAVILGVPNTAVNIDSCYAAWVSAANTVTVRFNNYSLGAIDPASATFRASVLKY